MIPASHAAEKIGRGPDRNPGALSWRLPRPDPLDPGRVTRRKRPKSFLTRSGRTHPSRGPRRRKASRNFRCHSCCYQIVKDLRADPRAEARNGPRPA